MGAYFRRSRSGCLTCRSLRTKCDEQKPHCRRCLDRGSICQGYVQQLRWIEQPVKADEPIALCSRRAASAKQHASHSSPLACRLSPYTLPHLHQSDQMILEHWILVTLPPSCLDPVSFDDLRGAYLDLVYQHKSVALHAMLAASAAHMLSRELIPEHVFVATQQRAIKSMILALRNFTCKTTVEDTCDQSCHLPSTSLDDATVLASLLLLGPEILHARDDFDFAHIRGLLQGARSLIVERHKYSACACPLAHPAQYEPQFRVHSPVFKSAVRSLAYTDVVACVPCARAPLIGKEYWLDDAIIAAQEGAQLMRPDMDLGYCAPILSLLGDCAVAVEGLYGGSIQPKAFSLRQRVLVRQFEAAMQELPQFADTESAEGHHAAKASEMIMAHSYSITVAICHALANQIFILRATDFDRCSAFIEKLSQHLCHAISNVPVDHPAATLMLWPIWVLGCESFADSTYPSRQYVTNILESAYETQRSKNIEICLTRLRRDIWTQGTGRTDENGALERLQAPAQSDWVRRCWDERIEVFLA